MKLIKTNFKIIAICYVNQLEGSPFNKTESTHHTDQRTTRNLKDPHFVKHAPNSKPYTSSPYPKKKSSLIELYLNGVMMN